MSFFERLIVLGMMAAMAGCHPDRGVVEKELERPVRVRAPRVLEQAERIAASGSVEARTTAKLGFEVAGRIAAVRVEEGQMVAAGQVVAELQATDYELDARAAEGDLEAARAVADKAAAGARRQEVEQARAAFAQADDEYRRLKALYDRKSLAPVDYQKIEAKWKAAREQLNLAEEGARAEDRRAAEAQARKAAAALDYKRKRLADTRLRAPFAGVVGRRLADPGDMAAAGTPVVVLLELNPARITVGVPEGEIGKVRTGMPARVRIPALEGREFAGTVELVGYAADPASRTFPVRIRAANPDYTLRAGMVAEAEIETTRRTRLLTLPGDAIMRDAQGATLVYLYYPEKQRVFARRVEVGRPAETELEIVSGLAPADRVVVAGQQLVREGARVVVEGGGQ